MTSFENELELLLTQAEEMLQSNRPAEALSFLDRARKIQPRHAWAMLFRGVALIQLGKTLEAVETLITAADENQQDIDIQVDAARHLTRLNHFQDALICARRALELNAFDAGAHAACGEALEELARIEEAVQHRELAVQYDAEDVDSRYCLAADLCDLSRFDEASAVAQPLFTAFADDPDIIRLQGACLSYQGDHYQALQCWAQIERLEGLSSSLLHNRAGSLDIIGRYEEALATINEAIEMEPDEALNYYTRGMIHEHLHDDAAAIDDYLASLARDPDSLETVVNLLDLSFALDIAPLVLERTRHIFPGNPPYAKLRYAQGRLLIETGRLKSAVRKLQSSVALEPSLGISWYSLMLLYGMLGDPQGVLNTSEYALRFFADDSLLWFHRGLAFHNLAKFPQALESYDRAMQLGDENMLASMQMARLMLFKLDRPEDARGVLREILHHQPENHSAMWMLALASYQLNDQQQAEILVTQLLQKSSGQLWGNLLRGTLSLPLSEVDEPLTDLAPVNETAHYLEILQNEKIFDMIFGDPLLQHIMQNQP